MFIDKIRNGGNWRHFRPKWFDSLNQFLHSHILLTKVLFKRVTWVKGLKLTSGILSAKTEATLEKWWLKASVNILESDSSESLMSNLYWSGAGFFCR